MGKVVKKFKDDDIEMDYTSRKNSKKKPSYHKGTSPRNANNDDDDEFERTTKRNYGSKKSNKRR